MEAKSENMQMKKIRSGIDLKKQIKKVGECGNFGSGWCCNKGKTGYCCNS